jgi:hypothetical protein
LARTNVTVDVIDTAAGALDRRETKNVTCVGGHEAVADFLGGTAAPEPAKLALGTGGSGGTDPSNRELNTEAARTPINRAASSNTTATIRAFVPSLLQLPSGLDEVGIVLDSSDLLNHATIDPVNLSGSDTLLVVTTNITVADPSQA